jgi:hypothetical protein
MKREISANVKIDKDFLNKVGFTCDVCGKSAEYLDDKHEDWYDFCEQQNRDPQQMMFAFRKTCGNECTGELKLIEKTTFDSFIPQPQNPHLTNTPFTYNLIK